jgi:hypothetical protein
MFIEDGRFTEGDPLDHLQDHPVTGVDSLAGMVTVIAMHGPEGGMTYEQLEPVASNWHRARSSGPVPNIVRPS